MNPDYWYKKFLMYGKDRVAVYRPRVTRLRVWNPRTGKFKTIRAGSKLGRQVVNQALKRKG